MGDGAHKKQEQQHNINKTRSEGGGRRRLRWYVGGGKGKEVKKGYKVGRKMMILALLLLLLIKISISISKPLIIE